ncbi:MAG: GNAT family N-acetyltransferase [Hyphomicrobiales bacterium]|nr:GNAT family N-acetyltransferase [Hyphomicrobiales bacterium]MCP5370893.1 GNAT family N-acetyltransferase [Hyphomicrobiales bacterium]
MARFADTADYFKVAEDGGAIAGFLIALTPGADYASPNFLWFRDRYAQFVYCDRILVAPAAKGRGLGRALYGDLAAFAAGRAPRITCEVNLRPPNPESLAFHARLGFREVGRQQTEGGAKEVALMAWDHGAP